MSGAFYIGAVAMNTQQRALDILANNIANMNTTAFKRSQVRFSDVVASGTGDDPVAADLSTAQDALSGVRFDQAFMIDDQGEIETTGHPLDLAIDGAGFIELLGPDGQSYLWRGGTLKVDADGLLSAANGMPLRANIRIPSDAQSLEIGRDGTVRAVMPDSTDPVEIGQIDVVKPEDATALERLDGGLYRVSDGAGLHDAQPGEDGTGMLVQGAIERSNVQLTDEMVALMLVQRAYSASAQILQAADGMMRIANELRG